MSTNKAFVIFVTVLLGCITVGGVVSDYTRSPMERCSDACGIRRGMKSWHAPDTCECNAVRP